VACASAIELRLDSDITTAPLERPSFAVPASARQR
jgi:hypothetical protein